MADIQVVSWSFVWTHDGNAKWQPVGFALVLYDGTWLAIRTITGTPEYQPGKLYDSSAAALEAVRKWAYEDIR